MFDAQGHYSEMIMSANRPKAETSPRIPPEVFDLGLAETPEVIQNRVVTRKALHAKQRVQSSIRP